MPLYEYECKKCGSVFEVLQKASDAAVTVHDHCGGTVERLISPPSFQFKGSGWYITDYAGKSSKNKDKDKETKASETATKDTTSNSKADTAKPAEKSSAAPKT